MSEKRTDISLCRVFATILILLCHIVKYYTFIPGYQILPQFFNVGVYIFIIISGYLYGMRKEKKISISLFYQTRLRKIVVPVLIWELVVFWFDKNSGLYNFVSVLLSVQGAKWISTNIPIVDGGEMMAHTWFVTVILICYLLIPIIKRIPNTKRCFVNTIIIIWSVAIVFSLFSINIFYFIAFITSYFYAGSQLDKRHHNKINLIIIMFVSVLVRVVGWKLFDNSPFYSFTLVNMTQIILAFSMLVIIKEATASNQLFTKIGNSKVIGWLDKNSYYIYIVHYGIIPFIYTNFSLQSASLLFCLSTFILTIILSKTDRFISYLISNFKSRST